MGYRLILFSTSNRFEFFILFLVNCQLDRTEVDAPLTVVDFDQPHPLVHQRLAQVDQSSLPPNFSVGPDSARVEQEELVSIDRDDFAAHGNLGIAYAGLGRREEAIREGKRAVDILPLSRNAKLGTGRISNLAEIYSMLGEQDAAIDQLEILLSIPSRITVPILKLDPQWDPLREHPRFKGLLEKYGER